MHFYFFFQEVEKIIEQDFFPDLTKMKAQSDYLVALETNDLVKLRELQMKYSKRPDTGRSMCKLLPTFIFLLIPFSINKR